MFDLTGKKVLITGSSQGIGKAIAKAVAKCGATLIIHGSSDIEKCRKAALEIGAPTAKLVVADLSTPNCANVLYEQTGDVDILILNASVQCRAKWNEILCPEFDYQINTNFKASLMLIQKYEPYMREKKWGRIITVGSVQQYKPHKDMAVYAATKCAQMSLVSNLAKQLAPFGITVNNLCPGVIATPRNDAALNDEAYAKKIMDGIPVGYAGMADDCAGAALLLCSNEGRYIVGTDIIVDGGMHL